MSAQPARPGTQILPGYRVISHLRRGEDTDVYDVWSDERECSCVLKTTVAGSRSRTARARLIREGELLVACTHPNLVRGYELHRRPRTALVMETVTGQTLGRLLDDEGRSPVAEICALGVQLASVLGYLHRQKVLHLDVKPSNIVIQEQQVKLLDLGIAGTAGVSPGYGTAAYMAPEQRRGGLIGAASDVWGVGATLYEAATGAAPFDSDGPSDGQTAPSVRRVRRLPRPVADVIDGCLTIAPHDRPRLSEVSQILRKALPDSA